jgi:hypothetical protein
MAWSISLSAFWGFVPPSGLAWVLFGVLSFGMTVAGIGL